MLWANQRLVPKAPHSSNVRAAEWYLSLFSPAYRLSRDSLRTVYIHRVHDTGRGAIAVFFRQRVGGIDVVRNEAKVVMKRDLSLVAITGNLHEAATPGTHSFARSPASALATAFGDKHNLTIPTGSVRSANRAIKAGYSYFELTPTAAMRAKSVTLTEPARVKPVLYPVRNRLVPAYYVEFFTGSLQSKQATAHGYMVAANDGAVLQRDDLTVDDSYTYRVWAEDSGRKLPLDGPQSDFTPHPTGAPDGSQPSFIPPNLVTIEGFNTNPEGGVDPWLPPGATETIGNNVDAYADLVEPDGFTDPGDIRATTTSPGTFDRVYDTAQPPNVSSDQIQAAVTQLFYTSNWLHNYFYDSGFNEAAGNAQASNFGRGGVEGDRMRVEAQDYSGVNNANMSTPGDGASPRMQMYVWSPESDANLTALDTTFTVGTAAFGPDNFELTAELSLIEDGTAPTTDGCEAIDTDLTGKIAIIDRGGCAFVVKAANAEARGAVGVVIVNNTPGAPPPGMAGTDPIGIPVLSITFEDGDTLKVAVTNGTVEATMDRLSGPVRDGTIDNAIVAHEWGHYIHFRLTSCQSTAQQCRAQSEGWGDFISLHMMVRPGDDLSGSYAMAYYSTISLGDNYFGVRRVPYTRYNPAINALTFRHVINGVPLPPHPLGSGAPDNAQVHNSGEVWASILIEGYFDMLAAAQGTNPPYTFAEAKRRMADYIVLGMQLAPVDPTFTEQLDAILAAVAATDSGDFVRLSLAYARRGVGTCAISAPRYSDTNIGAVEDFSLRGDMQLAEVTLGDAVNSCDSDGNLDGGETGQMSIDVFNPGIVAISNTTVTLSSPDLRVLFPDGPSATLSSVGSYATEQARINVALADNFTTTEDIPIVVTLNNPDTCTSTVVEETIRLVDFDIVPSTVDTVSNPEVSWAETFVGANIDVWNRVEDPTTAGNFVWHGIDAGTFTDTAIESPDLEVSPTDPLTIIFSQRYRFEADTIFWDGGVIEISSDGGATWEDISLYATPTYGGTVTDQAGNPLSNRMAYVGDSPGYPAFSNEALELGTTFAGQTVK
ncbi:MAG: M36 family metallopeptidase, partial [Myxococcota bacterium]